MPIKIHFLHAPLHLDFFPGYPWVVSNEQDGSFRQGIETMGAQYLIVPTRHSSENYICEEFRLHKCHIRVFATPLMTQMNFCEI